MVEIERFQRHQSKVVREIAAHKVHRVEKPGKWFGIEYAWVEQRFVESVHMDMKSRPRSLGNADRDPIFTQPYTT